VHEILTETMTCSRLAAGLLLAVSLSFSCQVNADTLQIEASGVDARIAENITAQLGGGWVSGAVLSSERRRNRFLARAETEAIIALRPFGYYFPSVSGGLNPAGEGVWQLSLEIQPGEPVTIRRLTIEIKGPGKDHPPFVKWLDEWPLQEGTRLVQPTWDEEKEELQDLTDKDGFLLAKFTEHRIELDLETNQADLFLVLETGPRAVMGEVAFVQDSVLEAVLIPVQRFEAGDPYRSWLVEQLRTDLWKLGFFDDIDLVEHRDLASDPPVVDLEARLVEGNKQTHQGTIGYGTDTEFRMQYRWQRHLLSERGDSLSAGFGWQHRNEELLLFGEYRLPRRVGSHQYWLVNPVLKREDQVFELDIEGTDQKIPLGAGQVDDFYLRVGRVKLRNPVVTREQIIETIHVTYLDERDNLDELVRRPAPVDDPDKDILFENSTRSLSVGMEWDWPVVQGTGFHTWGHRERAWWFHSNKAWGSDVEFTQLYLSSRWNFLLGDRWKILLRGEVGYTDAKVSELAFEVNDITALVSLTELPFQYRFKAGGSYSVRGYDFESLSNNGIGSNNTVVMSAELEYLFRDNWSVSVFADAGNAFNDWGSARLRKGFGVGVRWYTIGFPLRLDVAQARDLEGHPWQVHFTIGSPLL
jgi:translocation and assembly module TamA